MNLTPEEQELLESVESGEWEPIPNIDQAKTEYQTYAASMLKKDKRVNIRMTSRDLAAIQTRALEEGIPYQTLISSILHKYLTGRLREIT